ncbi:MAG: SDR family oxidoreductase [Anaerolineae bacterium]|nr:SDR family oxidoreductase [Anaerolineae bacterium]
MGTLDGKVAVITGSTRGLGLAIAQAYANEGAAVVVSSRTLKAVEQAIEDLQAHGYRASGLACDVSDQAQVQALAVHTVETWGHFDIWVNNAALSAPYGPTVHMAVENFLPVLTANIWGTYFGSLVALRHFLPRGTGKLINLLGAGNRKPSPNQNAYGSSKAWIRNFTMTLAQEYRSSGVGVYAFNPGLTDTDLLRRPIALAGYEERLNALSWVLRLWGNPPEVPAQKAVWLASSATDGKTGLDVRVGGGMALLGGVMREGLRRLTGRAEPPVELDVTVIPPAFKTN